MGLLVAGGVGLAGWMVFRATLPVPPIPVPANIATLDPQVREHLSRLVDRVSAAPRDGLLRSDLGLAFAVNGLWAEARQSFVDAVRLGDGRALPALYAAVALQEVGDGRGALVEFEAVVARHAGVAPAWYRLGLARLGMGDVAGAGEAFARVTQLAPGEWRGWVGVGEVRWRSGDAAGAKEALERALALDPLARSAYHLLGQVYEALGRRDDAEVARAAGRSGTVGPMPDGWSERALQHMKLLPDQFERADAWLAEGRIRDAVGLLREALRHHPNHPSVVARLARAWLADGQVEAARAVVEAARKAAPDDVELLTAAAGAAAAAGKVPEALELARRALERAPQSAEAMVAEANAWLAAEDDPAAAAALAKAVERAPDDVGLRIQLADLQWHNLGNPALAWETLMKARAIDPIHPPLLERLAELGIQRGAFEEVESALRELRRLRQSGSVVSELEGVVATERAKVMKAEEAR
jgi:tetratricopeptide (TPR) repeat protein